MPGSFVSGKCLDQMKLRLSRMTRRRTPIMLTALAAVMVSPYRWAFAPSKAHPRLRSLARGLCSRDRAGPAERPASPEQADPESAIQVNLSNETVRLPLYPGTAIGKTVWYVLLDASDAGLAHDLGGELRTQARQHRDQRPGRRADGDARQPGTAGEPVRA